MSQDHLDRIRGDLETLRQAAALDLPFGRDDVRTNLWVAACGVLIALASALNPWGFRGFFAVPLALAIAGAIWSARRAHQNRAVHPAPWREHRLGILALLIILPLVVIYMQWEKHVGIAREMVGAAAVFFVGVAMLLFALTDRRRFSYLAGAVSLMAFGLAVPLLERTQVVLAGGLCITAACLSAAAIQTYQLRRAGATDDAH